MENLKLFIDEYGTSVVLGGSAARLTKSFNCLEECVKEDYSAVERYCCGRSYDDWTFKKEGYVVKQFQNVTSLAEITETENYSSINEGHKTVSYFKNELKIWVEISKKEFEKLLRKYEAN